MISKRFQGVSVLFLSLLILGWTYPVRGKEKASPSAVARAYLSAFLSGKPEQTYPHLADRYRKLLPAAEFREGINKAVATVQRRYQGGKLDCTVLETTPRQVRLRLVLSKEDQLPVPFNMLLLWEKGKWRVANPFFVRPAPVWSLKLEAEAEAEVQAIMGMLRTFYDAWREAKYDTLYRSLSEATQQLVSRQQFRQWALARGRPEKMVDLGIDPEKLKDDDPRLEVDVSLLVWSKGQRSFATRTPFLVQEGETWKIDMTHYFAQSSGSKAEAEKDKEPEEPADEQEAAEEKP